MVVFKQNGVFANMGPKKIGLVLMLVAVPAIFFAAASLIGRPASEIKPAETGQIPTPLENQEMTVPAEDENTKFELPADQEAFEATSTEEVAVSTLAEDREDIPAAAGSAAPEQKTVAPVKTTTTSAPAKTASTVSAIPAKPAVSVDPKLASARDDQRGADMRRLASAQRYWYTDHKNYYASSGVPLSIGSITLKMADPINAGNVCSRDYVYCGISNIANTAKFCYYAKLEAGGYYIVAETGNAVSAAYPTGLDSCSALVIVANKPKVVEEVLPSTSKERDAARKVAMAQLVTAQSSWFGLMGRFYTCGFNGGDCQGNSRSYPAAMGFAMAKTPIDPTNTGTVCGRDYVYCGLDNTSNSAKFCYFSKLEGGGYYTATNGGNFERSSAPATFAECAQMN